MFENRTRLFVKEQVALLKLRDTYDLLEAEGQSSVGLAKDEPATWAKWTRLLVNKKLLPTTLNVYANSDPRPQLSIHKRPGFFRTRLEIRDSQGQLLAQVISKVFTLGGAFVIQDATGQSVGELKGDWKGWDYTASLRGEAIGRVTKKWAGLAKEMFTNADQYLVEAQQPQHFKLMLGLALSVDLVYKEQQG
ncbi:MAG: phospholipid scramblase-related protein [Holophaga sp.]|nr:phospholipid scramblase-related protein [Holophaga sp.]